MAIVAGLRAVGEGLPVLHLQHARQPDDDRGQRHRHGDDRAEQTRCLWAEQQPALCRAKQHKAEFAALGEQQAHRQCAGEWRAEQPGEEGNDPGLCRHHCQHDQEHQPCLFTQHGEVEAHADRHEEQPEQQAAERLDIGLKFVAVGRFGEHHARNKGPERHRQAKALHDERRAEHGEQRRDHKRFPCAEFADHPEQRVHQIASGERQAEDRHSGQQRLHPTGNGVRVGQARQGGDNGQQRHDGQVLKQQDRETALPHRGVEFFALLQQLHDQRCGGERQRQPDDQRCLPGETSDRQQDAGDRRAAQRDLQQPQPENVAPELPQAAGSQFKADDEQQHDDAEFGKAERRRGIIDQPEHRRPDQDARRQIAEHRAEFQPGEQRHNDHGGGEIDHRVAQQGRFGTSGRHGSGSPRVVGGGLQRRLRRCLKRQPDRAMSSLVRPRRGEQLQPRPVAGGIGVTFQEGGERIPRCDQFRRGFAEDILPEKRRRRLPQRTGPHLLPEPADPPIRVQIKVNRHPAPAHRRHPLDGGLRPHQPLLIRDSGSQAEDGGVVEGAGHCGSI